MCLPVVVVAAQELVVLVRMIDTVEVRRASPGDFPIQRCPPMPPTRSHSRARTSSRPRKHSHTHARAKKDDQSSAKSILSSVFTFVSREFDSFLSSATGREPHVEEVSLPCVLLLEYNSDRVLM